MKSENTKLADKEEVMIKFTTKCVLFMETYKKLKKQNDIEDDKLVFYYLTITELRNYIKLNNSIILEYLHTQNKKRLREYEQLKKDLEVQKEFIDKTFSIRNEIRDKSLGHIIDYKKSIQDTRKLYLESIEELYKSTKGLYKNKFKFQEEGKK